MSSTVVKKLQTISQKDREILESFFKGLFATGDFAYTLFGDKPMSCTQHRIESKFLQVNLYSRQKAMLEMRGWEVWKKYRDLFQLTEFHFSFSKVPNVSFCTNLISRKACLREIKNHFPLFQQLFGTSKSAEVILESVIEQLIEGSTITKDFKEHYFQCMGILFGYGQKNAKAFAERDFCKNKLCIAPLDLKKILPANNEPFIRDVYINRRTCRFSSEICAIEPKELWNKLQSLEENYECVKATHKSNPLLPLSTPIFMAVVNNPDTDSIKTAYDTLNEKLIKIYYSKQFLEIILTQLTGRK